MPGLSNTPRKTPAYRRHKASGQAVVTLNSVDFYLGRWRSKASRAEYARRIAEWVANDHRPLVRPNDLLSPLPKPIVKERAKLVE